MKIIETYIENLIVVEQKIFEDSRGFFIERFNEGEWQKNNLNMKFVQDNHSRSKPFVLRGMHMQNDPAQSKLVGVTRGSIIDVAIDLRPSSRTYGKSFSIELTDSNGKLLFVPAGFLHGFYVNSNVDTDVLYKVNGPYNSEGEVSIKWNDKDLNIDWPNLNPIVSDRDNNAMSLKEYEDKYLK